MRNTRACVRGAILAVGLVVAPWGPARAVDAVTGASKDALPAGTVDAAIWITGAGFEDGLRVTLSGDGVTPKRDPVVVQQEERLDGGRGDGIIFYFDLARDATPGARDVTVTNPDGSSATGAGLFRVLPPEAPPPDPPGPGPGPDGGAPPPAADAGEPPPPLQGGRVEVVSRASPTYGAQGDQVNLWIVGREFAPGLEVAFSVPDLGPALFEGEPLPIEVVRRAESERGKNDGIQYFLRIGQDVPPGPVDITVTNPADGSSATGVGLFTVVVPGQVPPPQPGDDDVQGVSGASPRAVRAGRSASLWIWGKGFEPGAQVRYSNPAIQPYVEPSVVEESRSNPGFAGVRSFVTIGPDAPTGPVDITIINPNGTQATGQGLVEIIGAAGTPGAPGEPPGGAVEYTGPCPDNQTSIEAVVRVQPPELERGEAYNIAIEGRAFACGASVVISGGGLRATDMPRLVRDAADPLRTTLFWQIEVTEDAALGPRDVTVVNPNNTSKTLTAAFEIIKPVEEPAGREEDVAFCQARPSAGGSPAALLLLAIPALVLRGRRRPRGRL